MLFDYHVHSAFSDDSEYPLELVIRDAVNMGLREIAITEHVDYGVKAEWDEPITPENTRMVRNVNYPAYFSMLKKLKEQYAGQIVIKEGLEFGIQHHTIPRFEALFAKHDLDFVIASCHQVEDKEFWTQEFQAGRSQKEYNERYYEEILRVVRNFENYCVLGHLDSIKRYDLAGFYPFENVKDITAEILKTVISRGHGIEVNTSTIRYGLPQWMPSWDILELYKDLGGEILTIGSDSHEPSHLGAYIQRCRGELKDRGFRYYCTFDKMKPVFHNL